MFKDTTSKEGITFKPSAALLIQCIFGDLQKKYAAAFSACVDAMFGSCGSESSRIAV